MNKYFSKNSFDKIHLDPIYCLFCVQRGYSSIYESFIMYQVWSSRMQRPAARSRMAHHALAYSDFNISKNDIIISFNIKCMVRVTIARVALDQREKIWTSNEFNKRWISLFILFRCTDFKNVPSSRPRENRETDLSSYWPKSEWIEMNFNLNFTK